MKQGAPLITFQPRGRLGNVMLQAAACIGYGKKHNVPWGVPRNTRESPRFHEYFPGLPICEQNYRGYQEHLNGDLCPLHGVGKDTCWFNYHPIPFHPQGVTLMGFWQSWKYFEGAEDEVRNAFRLMEILGLGDAIGLHVRRGDYVQHSDSFPPVTKEYVYQALKEFEFSTLRRVVVCSDDIEWCKETFGDRGHVGDAVYSFEYSTGLTEISDMAALASCHSNIIANSTFSWWAAWLNKNPDKIVVSPSHKRGNWFGMTSGVQSDCVDLLLPEWRQIEFR